MSDMFKLDEKLTARVQELESFRFCEMESIAPFVSMPGELGEDEVYHAIPAAVEGGTFRVGDEFIGRDRYLWAEKRVTLPPHREGCEVYGLFNFGDTGSGHNRGFESLLYVDAHPYQGVDTFHNDVNFDAMAGEEHTLTFMLWTGLEGGAIHKDFRHLFRQADVGYLHRDTDEFYYLTKAALETMELLAETEPLKYALCHALDRAFQRIDWDRDCFYETVSPALQQLKEELAALKKESDVTVNVVGHTHIDVAWLWRLKHTREKAMRSFSTVNRLMDEFSEYRFLQSQPQLYQFVKNDCPELYEKIRRRVAEGRWEADGGMWLEADCNISSGEALSRQFLYGMRFLQQEFGHTCEYLWLPDVFGYSWALPQILKNVGIDTFMTTKISWNQYNTMPHDLFRWRGIDGSEVMGYFITTPEEGRALDDRFSTYNGMLTPQTILGSWTKFHDKNLSRETLLSYGYGDGGGGVNRHMLKMRRAMAQVPGLPNVQTERAGNFFRRMHENIEKTDEYVPVWDGELYLEFHRGTYTSQGYNKMMNRRMEFALAECEWLSAMAKLCGGRYEQETLVKNWQTVLRNQFHDIIPGSSIHEVYQDSRKEYAGVAADVAAMNDRALGTLTHPEQDAWTLWHFGSFPRRDQVYIPEKREGVFTDDGGHVLPAQRSGEGYVVSVTLQPLCLTTVRFREAAAEAAAPAFRADLAARTLETPYYRLAWDENGALTSVYDLENCREVVAEGGLANQLKIYEDKPARFDNWELDVSHQFKWETARLTGTELRECGTLRAVVRFTYTYRHSTFVQDMTVYADSRRIDFVTEADWHEDHRVLKAAFPVDIRSTRATYDIQYGHVERPTHYNTSWDLARFEVVAHKWADLSEEGYGVSILNNCKYGHSVKDGLMQITLLKSGKHPDGEADMGHHSFTYALLPHAGSAASGDTIEEAVKLNLPVRCLRDAAAGGVPALRCAHRGVAIDAVKKAEDSDALIVRVHECRGGRAVTELVPGFRMKAWAKCNILEQETGERTEGSSVPVSLTPFQLQTYKIWVE